MHSIPDFIPMAYKNGRWHADLVRHRSLVRELRKEAGLNDAVFPDPENAYDLILDAAGKHGIGLETLIEE
jgi:hypothetical protein